MELMGLMLGEFVDEYTSRLVDIFAMPKSGTGVLVSRQFIIYSIHICSTFSNRLEGNNFCLLKLLSVLGSSGSKIHGIVHL